MTQNQIAQNQSVPYSRYHFLNAINAKVTRVLRHNQFLYTPRTYLMAHTLSIKIKLPILSDRHTKTVRACSPKGPAFQTTPFHNCVRRTQLTTAMAECVHLIKRTWWTCGALLLCRPHVVPGTATAGNQPKGGWSTGIPIPDNGRPILLSNRRGTPMNLDQFTITPPNLC